MDWITCWSTRANAPYLFNKTTQDAKWLNESECSAIEWIQLQSTSQKLPYWFNLVTEESSWNAPSQKGAKRARAESESYEDMLAKERQRTAANAPNFPYLYRSIDIKSLIARLRTEHSSAIPDDETANLKIEEHFEIIFTLPDEEVSKITRAVQEDEILKTKLKLKKGNEVINLPSFWDVWFSNPRLSQAILNSPDPNEAKWSSAKHFNYKMATTFMPQYAKSIYCYFQAKVVVDPCSGWGDRMLGADASSTYVTRYTGFDPNKNLRPGYAKIMELCGNSVTYLDETTIQFKNGFVMKSLPFEVGSVDIPSKSVDLVFTSPPFFDYEMYNNDNPEYKDWLKEFYTPLFLECNRIIKPQGFVCIHIADTSAGSIENFLQYNVHTFTNLSLVMRIGLTGVMSRKIRPVWVFRNNDRVTIPPYITYSNGDAAKARMLQWATGLTCPPLNISSHEDSRCPGKTFRLMDDGKLVGGSKQRLLGILLSTLNEEEIVYAGPEGGMAQVALAYTCKIWGKRAVVFLNGSSESMQSPLVQLAIKFGAQVHLQPSTFSTSLRQAQQSAQDYVAQNPCKRFLVPFGLKWKQGQPVFEMFRNSLLYVIQDVIRPPPTRLWIVAGSGFLFDVLHSIWPDTIFMIVQVGKTIWPDQLADVKHKLFVAPELFTEVSAIQPTYNTVPWYDAKLWQFVLKHGNSGDSIWNVGSVPANVEELANNMLHLIESSRPR